MCAALTAHHMYVQLQKFTKSTTSAPLTLHFTCTNTSIVILTSVVLHSCFQDTLRCERMGKASLIRKVTRRLLEGIEKRVEFQLLVEPLIV